MHSQNLALAAVVREMTSIFIVLRWTLFNPRIEYPATLLA